jgi:hypothetical protein
MPLSTPVARKPLHTRTIEFRGFEREDGLWDVEGRITDVKSYGYPNKDRGWIEAGEPVHDMSIRLTVDLDLMVHEAEATIEAGPYNVCGDIAPAFEALKGLQVGPGWYKRVKQRVGGVRGCTHVVEMLGPMATAVLQTLYPAMRERDEATPQAERKRPFQLDGCHALASDSPIVKERWPEFYTGE